MNLQLIFEKDIISVPSAGKLIDFARNILLLSEAVPFKLDLEFVSRLDWLPSLLVHGSLEAAIFCLVNSGQQIEFAFQAAFFAVPVRIKQSISTRSVSLSALWT